MDYLNSRGPFPPQQFCDTVTELTKHQIIFFIENLESEFGSLQSYAQTWASPTTSPIHFSVCKMNLMVLAFFSVALHICLEKINYILTTFYINIITVSVLTLSVFRTCQAFISQRLMGHWKKKQTSSSDVNFVILAHKKPLNKRRKNKIVILSQENIVHTAMWKNSLPDNIWRIAVAVTSQ